MMGATSRKNQALKPFAKRTDPIRNLPDGERRYFPQNQKKSKRWRAACRAIALCILLVTGMAEEDGITVIQVIGHA
jgi:hypothetical protein